MYDIAYIKFKNRQNESMVVEVRIVVTPGGDTDRERAQGTFWDDGNVLCICLDSGCNNYIHMQKLSSFSLKICTLYYILVCYTSVKIFKEANNSIHLCHP